MIPEDDLHCRVVIVGDSAVGKTSLLNRIVDDTFNQYELSTVGANYQLITRRVNGRKIEIQIWDTAGQEKFRSLSPIYFRNATGAIAVFSITSKTSYEHLSEWLSMFTEIAGDDTVIAIVANKCDLKNSIEVDLEPISESCKEKNYIFAETSAQNGYGVKDFFDTLSVKLVEKLLQKKKTNENDPIKKNVSRGCSC